MLIYLNSLMNKSEPDPIELLSFKIKNFKKIHLDKEEVEKFKILLILKKRCKKAGVLLNWKKCILDNNKKIYKLINKPPEVLELECKYIEINKNYKCKYIFTKGRNKGIYCDKKF